MDKRLDHGVAREWHDKTGTVGRFWPLNTTSPVLLSRVGVDYMQM